MKSAVKNGERLDFIKGMELKAARIKPEKPKTKMTVLWLEVEGDGASVTKALAELAKLR